MKKILIVDDDITINSLLTEILTKNGYSVIRAWSGTEALMLFEKQRPDLIILDLMLPGMSGEELLPQIKDIPVIVLSAKISVSDKISLLTLGASDYVTKPFDTEELLARINVQLRGRPSAQNSVIAYNEIELDTLSHTVCVNSSPVSLTRTEYAILRALLANPGRAMSKSAILDEITLDTPDCTEDSLKVHVSNLRHKLQSAGAQDYISSVWGIGFIFGK